MRLLVRHYRALERVFERQLEGGFLQSKAKIYEELAQDEYVEWRRLTIGRDRFGPIVIEGWEMTHRGMIYYCEWASNQPDSQNQE